MNKTLICLLLPLLPFLSYGQQQLTSPHIINFDAKNYGGGIQNWNIGQNAQGIMLFGNNEGLLTFNGHYWNLFPLPNRTVVRSLGVGQEEKIYVGGQDEIGYFSPNSRGLLHYHSLKQFIPVSERQFGDVWNLAVQDKDVFFRESNKIFHYRSNHITVYKPKGYWVFLGQLNGKIFAQDSGKGLLVYQDGYWKALFTNEQIGGSLVTSILNYDQDQLLVSTLDKGLFLLHKKGAITPFHSPLMPAFISKNIYSGLRLTNGRFALGTTSGGLLILDRNGNLLKQYAYPEGLQTNNIRSIFQDRQANIWLGLDDGIALIPYNKPINYIIPDKEKVVTGYAMAKYNHALYFGTSDGVYTFKLKEKSVDLSEETGTFVPISHTGGQVWNIQEINGHLLLSHDKGLYDLTGGPASLLYPNPGTWLVQPVKPIFPAHDLISGTYTGLNYLQFEQGKFQNKGPLTQISESIRFMFFDTDGQRLWASHPYRGIYEFTLHPSYKALSRTKTYGKADGLPSILYNYVFNIRNEIMAGTEDGIYRYSAGKKRFEPDPTLYSLTKGMHIQYLKEDQQGNIWFVADKKVGLITYMHQNQRQVQMLDFPELEGQVVAGHEFIFPYNDENIFVASNKGFIHLNLTKYKAQQTRPDIVLNRISLLDQPDSVLLGGFYAGNLSSPKVTSVTLSSKQRSIHFEYASPNFDKKELTQFRYKLEGFDTRWSPWEKKAEKDYTNLSPGTYTFLVKARDRNDLESKTIAYTFTILPAWYQHPMAYVIYILLALALIFILFKRQKRKFQQAQAQQAYLHQLEIANSEKEIVRLKNEKLETEVAFKDKELTTMTMHLVQRGEVLNNLKGAITQLIKKNKAETDPGFKSLLRIIREAERTEEDWENFAAHFNHVHADYFDKLRTHFPDITPHELRLCAYIKMNLTSKEIAQLMNSTIKAVEVSRYRLRKKLQLSSDVNLNHFLSTFYKED